MPSSTFTLFDEAVRYLNDGTIDLDTHTFIAVLTNSAVAKATNTVLANITPLTPGNGYSTLTLTATWAETGGGTGVWRFAHNADWTLTASGGSFGPFQYVVIYDDTPTSPVDPLLGYWDYGSAITVASGEQFVLDLDANFAIFTADATTVSRMNIIKNRSVPSDAIERYLGPEIIAQLTTAMGGGGPYNAPQWYGPPIHVANVPGNVLIGRDGDFIGDLRTNGEVPLVERMVNANERFLKRLRKLTAGDLNAFANLSALIAAITGGKSQRLYWQKVGTTGVVASTNTLWYVGNQPAAGAAAAAAPGGTVPTSASTGALPFVNPSSANSNAFITAYLSSSVAANTMLLYDRIFSVTKTMNSTGTESVTGVPSRYQNTTSGNADSADGNFLIIETRAVLTGAPAHNWTVCLYTDQNGNGSATLPSVTSPGATIVNRLDQPAGTWFCPLASGDYGIKELDQMQCSALVTTGSIDFTIGHPIAFMPCPVASLFNVIDGINSAVNLAKIYDNACLAFLELIKPATTATTYSGEVMICAE